MEHVAVHTLDLSSLFEVSGRTPEEACIQVRTVCCIEWFLSPSFCGWTARNCEFTLSLPARVNKKNFCFRFECSQIRGLFGKQPLVSC
jgi:hypothetical protein